MDKNKKQIPLSVVSGQNFITGVQKVFDQAELNIKKAHQLNKYIKKLNNETKSYQEVVQKFVKDFAKRDENGEILQSEGGGVSIDLTNKDVQAKNKELNELSVDIDIEFDLNEIENIKLTAAEIEALTPLIPELQSEDATP